MKKDGFTNNLLWEISSLGFLSIFYWLCRFVFFDIHEMKEWPTFLAIVALIILIVASFLKLRRLSVACILGYIGGFALGVVFNTDGRDAKGAITNNLWIIWTVILLICTIVGIVIEIAVNRKK